MKSLIGFKKLKNGDVIVLFDLPDFFQFPRTIWLRVRQAILKAAWFFLLILEPLFSRYRFLLVVAALGLGFGVGITIFQRPDVATALLSPTVYSSTTQKLNVEQLFFRDKKTNQYNLSVDVTQEKEPLVSLNGAIGYQIPTSFPSIEQNVTIYLSSDESTNQTFDQLKPGDRFRVLKQNNGVYTYIVVETKFIHRDELVSSQLQTFPSLVLYTRSLLNPNQLTVVVCRQQ